MVYKGLCWLAFFSGKDQIERMGDLVMKQCEKGHFYDDNRFGDCPYCKEGTGLGKQAFQNQQIPQFQTAPQQPAPSAPSQAASGFKFCTKCGNRAEASAKFCTGCGNPFPAAAPTPSSDIGKTVGVAPAAPASDIGKTVAVKPMTSPTSDIGKTVAVKPMSAPAASDIGKTVAVQPSAPVAPAAPAAPTAPVAPAAPVAPVIPAAPVTPTSDIGKTVALQPVVEIKSSTSDIGKTVALRMPEPEKKPAKTKPAAFMVCIAGDNAGDSFTVAEGRNYIASGKDADIKLDKDSTVSAECHAVVTYNPAENKFTLSAGTGRGITYLNGGQVDVSSELKADDRIKVGKSELLFIPVCSDKFKWEDKA